MVSAMEKFKGAFTIAFTPFTEAGDVDCSQFERQVDYLASTGAGGVVLYGMTSEYHKLTDDEKKRLTSSFLKTLKGREPVSVLSVTDWSTECAVVRAKEYEALGVDMLMLMPPFYYGPTLEEVTHHIISILEAVKIPVIIQYAPLATKLYMPEQALVDISERYPNAAFKIEYKPAVEFLQNFFDLKPDLPVMTGWAGLEMIELNRIGVRGVLTVGGFTELYVAIYRALHEKDFESAQAIYGRMEGYLLKWMQTPESLLAIEKEIVRRRGIFKSSYCRRPAYHLTPENNREINDFLKEFHDYLF